MTSSSILGSDLTDVVHRCDRALSDFLDRQCGPGQDSAVALLTDETRHFVLGGGKRLRPALCYWGWRSTGCPDRPEIVVAAAALELLHAFALIHDDVMDGSDQRRGRPTVRRRFTDRYPQQSRPGDAHQYSDARQSADARRYGDNAALLAGDLCAAWADQMFNSCGLPPAQLDNARPLLAGMRTEMIAGQFLDLQSATGPSTADRALQVVTLKSARYTVTRPLQIGAALAGAGPSTLAALQRFGDPLGVAFQLRDDLLGVFGDPARTGKPALDDLREGKQTMLIVSAREHAEPQQRVHLDRLLGRSDLDETGAAQIRRILEDCGARRHVENLIDHHHRTACRELEQAPMTDDARRALAALATRLVVRDS